MSTRPLSSRRVTLLIAACLFALASRARAALTADDLLLVVNRNVPVSVKTAEFYAKARLVPDGRIVKLDLPGGEEMPFDVYEQKVVPPIREYIRANHLESKIKCLVTFYGVPFRIGSKQLTPQEQDEALEVRKQLDAVAQQALPYVTDAEKLATELNSAYVPHEGQTIDRLIERMNTAMVDINQHLPADMGSQKSPVLARLLKLISAGGGDAQIAARLSDAEVVQMLPPDTAKTWPARRKQIDQYQAEIATLQEKRYDADARRRLREITRDAFGVLGHGDMLKAQLDYLQTDGTVSATDNELALLWWNWYNHAKWQINPLNVHFRGPHPPMLMTCRLDGPQEGTAMQIILSSLKAEREGLKGRVVIDSSGGTGPGGTADRRGGYRDFDEKLLRLAELVRTKTNYALTVDRTSKLLPPNSVKDVAIYTGWYSVRNYIPACQFKVGAVGYHIASFEMVSLRADNEKGWVAGLLNDGIAATLGAVAEPYLSAFPSPDEFFPLLLTGKLTLAEVYWKTVPMTSWMMCVIGDPLYVPFKINPLLKAEDLPPGLPQALEDAPAATMPVGQ